MANNNNKLHKAKETKDDEFYTKYDDIEQELKHYTKHLKGKIIYCNADDYRKSNFYKYLKDNFNQLGLKKLIATCYVKQTPSLFETIDNPAVYAIYDGETETTGRLRYDGDFRRKECRDFLDESDIVITNPPFSLYRKFIAQLMKHKKDFIIIGPLHSVSYNGIIDYIKNETIRISQVPHYRKYVMDFERPEEDEKTVLAKWFTTLDNGIEPKDLPLTYKYDPEIHKTYDDYPAINIDNVHTIPKDYDGWMAVPFTFFQNKWNPKQFRIVDHNRHKKIEGKDKFIRITIQKI